MKFNKAHWMILAVVIVLGNISLYQFLIYRNNQKILGLYKRIALEIQFANYADYSFRLKSNTYNSEDVSNMIEGFFEFWLQHDAKSFNHRVKFFHGKKDAGLLDMIYKKLESADPLNLQHLGPLDTVLQNESFYILGTDDQGHLLRFYSLKHVINSKTEGQSYNQISKEFSNNLRESLDRYNRSVD